MILLSITMFILGILAFADAIFNYGNMFRMSFSGLLILMSVWVYMKTRGLNDLERPDIVTAHGSNNQKVARNNEVELTRKLENTEKKPEKVPQ